MTGDNPPAFPHVTQEKAAGSSTIYTRVSEGMTLRDWFAGQAIIGMLARGYGSAGSGVLAERTAREAYGLADTMIAARKSGDA